MKTRTKLIDKASVKKVLGELTIDEKLNLVGEHSFFVSAGWGNRC